MHLRIHPFAAVMLGTATLSSMACVLAPKDPVRIKQMMAREIAHRLGVGLLQVPLSAIAAPQLHAPSGGDKDCRGVGGYHYSAGFTVVAPATLSRPAAAPLRWPEYAREPSQEVVSKKRRSSTKGGWQNLRDQPPARWSRPVHCVYEGVAVVLGYGYSSPVAVNFERKC